MATISGMVPTGRQQTDSRRNTRGPSSEVCWFPSCCLSLGLRITRFSTNERPRRVTKGVQEWLAFSECPTVRHWKKLWMLLARSCSETRCAACICAVVCMGVRTRGNGLLRWPKRQSTEKRVRGGVCRGGGGEETKNEDMQQLRYFFFCAVMRRGGLEGGGGDMMSGRVRSITG